MVADVTPGGSPDRAERADLIKIFGVFLPIQAVFVIGEPFFGVRTPS